MEHSRQKLISEFRLAKASGTLDNRIPDPENNGNYDKSISELYEYIRVHTESAALKEFPYIVNKARLSPSSKLLDYGCGWGRLTFAASNYLDDQGSYVGLDINREAIDFLKSGYSLYPNFEFVLQEISDEENYIYLNEGKTSSSNIKSSDLIIPDKYRNYFDAIFSHSVFTHMWMEGIVHTLKQQAKVLCNGGICINTWLVIDEYAQYVLRCGLADRQLPFRVNCAFTYDTQNPLLCTAYSLQDVYRMYTQAGHQIISIEPGSWAGRDNGVTYQDIILSKPFVAL